MIDCNSRKWRYTSGVVAFHADDDPSDDQQAAVMADFESAAFAGLERDQAGTSNFHRFPLFVGRSAA
ncbi:hypothetical protein [Paracoccus marinaquae]|uniref:Uncharacterized protein n=1 Tax=Paracoccus marinaquae TaxID=2841926 RepID=A0ABS6ALU1_9RHOB|nr:hypothetical protein [Paracoccus marinaquae]MBU3030847.1 hypothetical protein [Paracoccus marinaquae]